MKPEDPMARMREAHRESYERKLWIIDHSCSQLMLSCAHVLNCACAEAVLMMTVPCISFSSLYFYTRCFILRGRGAFPLPLAPGLGLLAFALLGLAVRFDGDCNPVG